MSDDEKEMNKAQRLALAGAVAPSLRRGSDRARVRPVKLYDQQTGEVTRHTSLAEAQEGILRTLAIEIDVVDGVRPTAIVCEFCGRPVKVEHGGTLPKVCRGGCEQQRTCAEEGCHRVPPVGAFEPAKIRLRKGAPWKCRAHYLTADQRREAGRRLQCNLTPEKRSEAARRGYESKTPEERQRHADRSREASLRGHARKTDEERREIARRRAASMTAEQRSAISAKGAATMTDEQRAERSRRIWATRRANAKQPAVREEDDA